MNIQRQSKQTPKTDNDLGKRTCTAGRRVMLYSCAAHQQCLAPAQWALLHIHHVSFLVHKDGTDLMHWMKNYLFFHMPVLVIGFSGSCQILPFANKGHMFPQRKVWYMACWWFCNLGFSRTNPNTTQVSTSIFVLPYFVSSVLPMFLIFRQDKIIKKTNKWWPLAKQCKIMFTISNEVKHLFYFLSFCLDAHPP